MLSGVDVLAPRPVHAVVAVGDSITDGVGSAPDTDARWTDALAGRLARRGGAATMAVLNAGISRNELLADRGRWAASAAGAVPPRRRGVPGATDVVLNIGTNDIAAGRDDRAIEAGLVRFAATPGRRASGCSSRRSRRRRGTHGTPRAVATRDAVNAWVRAHGREHAGGVFDFAAAVADPAQPGRARPLRRGGRAAPVGGGLPGARGRGGGRALTGSPCLADGAPARSRCPTAAPAAELDDHRVDGLLAAEPAQAALAGGLDGDQRERAGGGVLAVEPVDHPVDGQGARRDAARRGDAAQLLDAQRGQSQLEHLGRPEPPGGRARGGVRRERGEVGVELGIVRRQLRLGAGLARGRGAVPCAPGDVTGSHVAAYGPPSPVGAVR